MQLKVCEDDMDVLLQLLMADNAFGLGRRCWSSSEWCYLTVSVLEEHIVVI